jgi:hypothetical protein
MTMGDIPVTWSERALEALVRALYPSGFSARYGREMSQAFGQLCQDARQRSGVIGIHRLWMSELPPLVIGALSERSTTMARGMRAVGRVGVQKTVVMANAVVLVVLGGALLFWALDLLVTYGMLTSSQVPAPPSTWAGEPILAVKMTAQTLGAALAGFGIVVGSFLVRTDRAAPHGRLAWAHAVISFGFGLILLQYTNALGWLTLAAFLTFTACYTLLWATEAATRSRMVRHGRGPSGGVKRDPVRA